MPRALSSERSRTLKARVAAFSSWPSFRCPPVSSPPCAASITTTKRDGGAGGAGGACCAGVTLASPDVARRTAAAHGPRAPQLLQRIDREPAQQLGIEISGLLRHHFACEGDFLELLQRNGIGKEGDIG